MKNCATKVGQICIAGHNRKCLDFPGFSNDKNESHAVQCTISPYQIRLIFGAAARSLRDSIPCRLSSTSHFRPWLHQCTLIVYEHSFLRASATCVSLSSCRRVPARPDCTDLQSNRCHGQRLPLSDECAPAVYHTTIRRGAVKMRCEICPTRAIFTPPPPTHTYKCELFTRLN